MTQKFPKPNLPPTLCIHIALPMDKISAHHINSQHFPTSNLPTSQHHNVAHERTNSVVISSLLTLTLANLTSTLENLTCDCLTSTLEILPTYAITERS